MTNEIYSMVIVCIVLTVLSLAVGIIACVLIVRSHKKQNEGDLTIEQIRIENERLKNELNMSVKLGNSMMSGSINVQNENYKHLVERFDNFTVVTDKKIEQLREDTHRALSDVSRTTVQTINEMKSVNIQVLKEVRDDNARNLENIKKDNSEQLEKMRQTVDEKLSSTLETRFDRSFKIVNDRLEEINRTFGELQGLQSGISDLNKIFKNVKTRGTWGEVSLENLLGQILAPEQFEKQVRIRRGSEDAVDFVIKMPGKGDGEVLLPIDAKFPIEDYARLAEASDRADAEGVESAVKALAMRIKSEAMSIRDKYIAPPKTTDFAVMYLPTEGLYAEVIRREGLVEDIQNKYRVVVCGPTTIAALLNSLQMGFKSVAIEKRSTEIGKLLQSFVGDFEKFSKLLRQTGDKLGNVQQTLATAESRTELIRKKLDKVSKITGEDDTISESGDGTLLID